MGNTESSNSLTQITNQAVAISAQSITNCMVQASQQQTASIKGFSIGRGNKRTINQSMEMVMDVNCEQKAQVDLDIQQAVISSIKQEAKSQGVDIALLTNSESSNTINITNNISSDINMDSIVNTGVALVQNQQAEILGGIIGVDNEDSIKQGMTAEVFLAGLSDTIKKSKVVQDIASEIDQKSSAKTDSTITNVVKSVTSAFTSTMGIYAIIFIAVIIGFVVLSKSILSGPVGAMAMDSFDDYYTDDYYTDDSVIKT
jgi:hypothetical protein